MVQISLEIVYDLQDPLQALLVQHNLKHLEVATTSCSVELYLVLNSGDVLSAMVHETVNR